MKTRVVEALKVRDEAKENRERVIKLESAVTAAHKRLDEITRSIHP